MLLALVCCISMFFRPSFAIKLQLAATLNVDKFGQVRPLAFHYMLDEILA